MRGDYDAEYLQEIAGEVDRTMRSIAERVATVDAAKIAILAALNLADGLIRCQRRQQGEPENISEKLVELTKRLGSALDGVDDDAASAAGERR